jgi:hypothetical protein
MGNGYGCYNGRKNILYMDGNIETTGVVTDSNWNLIRVTRNSLGMNTLYSFGQAINSNYTQTGFDGIGVNFGTDSNQSSDCEVAEVMVFDNVLSIGETSNVESYLTNKYGLVTNYQNLQTPFPVQLPFYQSTISSLSSVSNLKYWFDPNQVTSSHTSL